MPQFKELLIGNTLGNNQKDFGEVFQPVTQSTEIGLVDVLLDGSNVLLCGVCGRM